MNRIRGRAKFLLILILVLIIGTGVFVNDYITQSRNWVMHAGSPHIYEQGKLGCGVITDRDQILLLDLNGGRTYSGLPSLRTSFLHWLGDRQGNISTPALTEYAKEMSGFDPVSGLYSYGGIGGNLTLTLSARLQKTALEAMGEYKGTIAIMNYKTGEILCAVTTPTFDPDHVPDIAGDTTGAYTGAYMNRFLQSTYAPGSIFKIVTLAAALETIPDIESMHFNCTGIVEYGIDKVTCEKVHGELTLAEAFKFSCNCSFARIADLVGAETLERYIRQFGVVDSLYFDGIRTARGNYDLQNNAGVLVAWTAIGQHKDLVNPCTYLNFLSAIARDGMAAEPYVVKSVVVDGKTTYCPTGAPSQRIMSTDTAQTLQKYLRRNVAEYYGDENFPGLAVCAKSGTAQVGADRKANAMFTGFVDDERYPLAFIVCIEDGGYGRHVCTPVLAPVLAEAKDMLDGN